MPNGPGAPGGAGQAWDPNAQPQQGPQPGYPQQYAPQGYPQQYAPQGYPQPGYPQQQPPPAQPPEGASPGDLLADPAKAAALLTFLPKEKMDALINGLIETDPELAVNLSTTILTRIKGS